MQRNSLKQTGASNQGLTLTVVPTTDLHRADLSEQYFHSNQDSQFQLLPGFPLHEKSDIQPTNNIFSPPCHDKVDQSGQLVREPVQMTWEVFSDCLLMKSHICSTTIPSNSAVAQSGANVSKNPGFSLCIPGLWGCGPELGMVLPVW